MIIGWGDIDRETPGRITDINIFYSPLTNMKEITLRETENCGAAEDFLNWEAAHWTLHSKVGIVDDVETFH